MQRTHTYHLPNRTLNNQICCHWHQETPAMVANFSFLLKLKALLLAGAPKFLSNTNTNRNRHASLISPSIGYWHPNKKRTRSAQLNLTHICGLVNCGHNPACFLLPPPGPAPGVNWPGSPMNVLDRRRQLPDPLESL